MEAARAKIAAFARESLSEPWLAPGLLVHAPVGRWKSTIDWSVRGGIAVMCGMFFDTLPELKGQNWQTAPVLTPVLAVAMCGLAPIRYCGAVMLLCRL